MYDICYINDVENANIESKYAVDANESISDYNIDIVKRSEKQRNFEF